MLYLELTSIGFSEEVSPSLVPSRPSASVERSLEDLFLFFLSPTSQQLLAAMISIKGVFLTPNRDPKPFVSHNVSSASQEFASSFIPCTFNALFVMQTSAQFPPYSLQAHLIRSFVGEYAPFALFGLGDLFYDQSLG